ncbi:hypothetical protein Lepto7375DRAFT_2017 [Leptolyngbya sp. PCC 7375]|nr:hypothetical protein Lepto7375DRAFT_2017 [Leptolyngbya sp. PCC 7375]
MMRIFVKHQVCLTEERIRYLRAGTIPAPTEFCILNWIYHHSNSLETIMTVAQNLRLPYPRSQLKGPSKQADSFNIGT